MGACDGETPAACTRHVISPSACAWSIKARTDDEAAVVRVRVGQHDRVEFRRRDREAVPPVAQPELLQPLIQARVDKHAPTPMLQRVRRAGHRTGTAEKRQAHLQSSRSHAALHDRATGIRRLDCPSMLSSYCDLYITV